MADVSGYRNNVLCKGKAVARVRYGRLSGSLHPPSPCKSAAFPPCPARAAPHAATREGSRCVYGYRIEMPCHYPCGGTEGDGEGCIGVSGTSSTSCSDEGRITRSVPVLSASFLIFPEYSMAAAPYLPVLFVKEMGKDV